MELLMITLIKEYKGHIVRLWEDERGNWGYFVDDNTNDLYQASSECEEVIDKFLINMEDI
jgi:VCBS repeat-containing protein